MKCLYCRTEVGDQLPVDCSGCGAHLTLSVRDDTLLRELARAVHDNGYQLTFKLDEERQRPALEPLLITGLPAHRRGDTYRGLMLPDVRHDDQVPKRCTHQPEEEKE